MKIVKIEEGVAKNQNPMKKVTLSEKVNGRDMLFVFSDHTRFADIKEGMELGPDEVVADGQYVKLVDPDAGIKGKGGSRTGAITAAQNRKSEMISQAQENKEEGIKLSSTIRMATDIVIARGVSGLSEEEVKAEIEKWRSYFYTNWSEITQDEPPF